MEIQDLRIFLAVAEELHFGHAAERLHLAQPPVSRGVRRLEEELGARLFERTTRSVRLTAEGEALCGPAQDMLDAHRRAQLVVKAAGQGEVGLVRVAFAGASTHSMVGTLARQVRQDHPGIQFELHSQNFAMPALSKVLRGEMEIGFSRWDGAIPGLAARVLAHENLVVAVSASHRLAQRKTVRIEELAHEPFVSLPPYSGSVLIDRLRSLSHSAGFSADVVQIAPDTWTLLALVEAEVGCALTLTTVADNVNTPGVRYLRVTDHYEPIALRMAWREQGDTGAVATVLRLADRVLPTPTAG
ncbi:LysR family transcriptional regulator [Streptomyces chiangmaiensis]|uniref:LysR substrate-binding domain-containing protein n=1 Tax=Streptomyces chiangmaiensis TaxID=766497 RepID=A0ABU7FRH7_9ACTN|nr:LysR substrate-binding domain-containing protein [Streptomyces chiangmaiensis]MED7826715.1 LysR substrate-binding domain-containing protein [Streptomyces chiangmaiensis]